MLKIGVLLVVLVVLSITGCARPDKFKMTDETLNKIAECTGGMGGATKLLAKIEVSVDEKKKSGTGSANINYEEIIEGVIFSDSSISEDLKKFYFTEYQKCLDKIRNREEPIIACPDSYQSSYISQLRFGFCYPRAGWELDRGAIDVRAADIYLRVAKNRDTSVHYHVSLIPSNYSEKHEEYSQHVANTWKQIDKNLEFSKGFLSGRPYYKFKLLVQDKNQVYRPTEVLHVYLTSEKLLEIISTKFKETSAETDMEISTIVSSTSVYK